MHFYIQSSTSWFTNICIICEQYFFKLVYNKESISWLDQIMLFHWVLIYLRKCVNCPKVWGLPNVLIWLSDIWAQSIYKKCKMQTKIYISKWKQILWQADNKHKHILPRSFFSTNINLYIPVCKKVVKFYVWTQHMGWRSK